jgi:4-alpha-glucanotransferase
MYIAAHERFREQRRKMTDETISRKSPLDAMPSKRAAGISMHITSLPGRYGIGEIGDEARAFVDTMSRMGLTVWQVLPLGPTGYGDSPYQPLSSFAGNEMLIDFATFIRVGLITSSEADGLLNLSTDAVDYGAVIPGKRALLKRATSRFGVHADAAIKAEFDRYLDGNDQLWLHDYALFRVLKTRYNERAWTDWPAEYANREPAALRKAEAEFANDIENTKILQFLLHRQWQRLRRHAEENGIALLGDMPIYVALDSADAWANRDIVMLDDDGRPSRVAGVPPDYFSKDGQLWGTPVYDWDYHARTGFQWWIDRLQKAVEQFDLVRIDHFRGFESYWSVPADAATAREGEWIKGPGDAIFRALGAALGELPIVAEDLGVITDRVDALRARHNIPGMKVLQFEIDRDDFDPADISRDTVCYTATHDNDTTLGWFTGSEADARSPEAVRATRRKALKATGGAPESIHNDMIRLAFSTDAQLAIAPLQDYLGLGSEARMNAPGKPDGNWRWRVLPEQLTPSFCDSVAELVDTANRV